MAFWSATKRTILGIPGGRPGSSHYEMGVVGLEIENLKKADSPSSQAAASCRSAITAQSAQCLHFLLMLTCILLRLCSHCALSVLRLAQYKRSGFCFWRALAGVWPNHAGTYFGKAGEFGHRTADCRRGHRILQFNQQPGRRSTSDASGYYYLPLLSPGLYRVRVTAPAYQSQEVQELELTVAARDRARFPSAAAQRCLGSGRIQQRIPARIENHRHVFRTRRGLQQIRIVRSAEGAARGAGVDRFGGDRFGRNQQSSAAGPRCLHDAGDAAGRDFRFRDRPRTWALGERAAAFGFEFSAGWRWRTTII